MLNSLVFETEAGEPVSVVPVYSSFRVHAAEWELKLMLEQAKRRSL